MNELKQALAIVLELASSMIDEMDDATLQALTDIIVAATEKLVGMQQNPVEGMQPSQGAVPQLNQGAYPSSNINSYKYDPASGRLFVKFHGKDTAGSGPTYKYEGVPKNIYDVFSRGGVGPLTSGQNKYHRWVRGVTPSLGAALYGLIKTGGYPYQRMS